MEIICLQENFKKAVSTVQNIIGKNLTLPILNNVLLTVEKKQLRLISTDLELAITHWAPGKVKKEGEITVPAKLLNDLVNNLPNKKIEIKTRDDSLQVKCEGFKLSIKGMNSKEFPIVPKIKGELAAKIEASKLKQALAQVANFTSLSDIRPEISGIFVNFSPKDIKFVATDSFRLGEKTISLKGGKVQGKKSVIIPIKTVQELIRILGDQEKDGIVEILIEQNQVLFKIPDTQIISRLIEGTYPNYERLISKQFETSLILNREEFIEVVRIGSLFSGRINDVKLRVIPKKSLVEVFAQDVEIGENLSEIRGEIKGKDVEIVFNHKYLLDGLSNISSDKIMLGLNGEINPGILKPVGDPNYIYVIMPIKL